MQTEDIAVKRYKAEQAYKAAASWFWWIGALSILNSAIIMNGKQFNFTFGLGVSQIGDALMAGGSGLLSTLGLFLSFGFSGAFLLLAWLSQHTKVALPIGVALYGADSLLFLFFQDWLGLGFHLFALFLIVAGWRASRRLGAEAEQPVMMPPSVPSESTSQAG